MEAADALCPGLAQLYGKGGPAFDAMMRAQIGEWSELLDPAPDDWLAGHLVEVLRTRPDLLLTGRNLARSVDAPRTRLPHDLLIAFGFEPGAGSGDPRVYVTLRLRTGRVEMAYSFSSIHDGQPEDFDLIEVRIESQQWPGLQAPTPQTGAPRPPGAPDQRPQYTLKACRAWLLLRVGIWPPDAPASTEDRCLADARSYFAGDVPRDAFRKVRREVVPASWKKPGPRVSRK